MSKSKISFAFKFAAVLLIAGFILSFPFTSVFAKINYTEIYNYEMEYDLYVPNEYKDSMVDIGSGALNIQFNNDVYLSLKADDYYGSLSSEDRGKNKANDYSMDKKALDDTYNDLEFVTGYFNAKLDTIIGKKRVASIEKKSINGSKFWICSYIIYTESTDPQTQKIVQTDVGEGRMYLDMTNGIRYFIVVNSSNGLLSETPDAVKTVESFNIGRKSNPSIIILWVVIIACIIGFLIFLNNKLKMFSVEMEDEEGNTIILSGVKENLDAIADEDDEYEKFLNRENKVSDKTISLKNVKELLQEKIDQIKTIKQPQAAKVEEPVENFDEEGQLSNNKIILDKLDILLERHAQGKDKQPQPGDEIISLKKSNEEILNDLDEILGRS